MTRLRVHYDGWVVLPADLRRRLALGPDAELEVELGEGEVALRPLGAPVSEPEPPAAASPPPRPMRQQKPAAGDVAAPARRPTASVAARLLPALKARGRRRKAQ